MAQHKAIKNACDDYFRVEKICEWDARAIISYANIHYNFIVYNILLENNIHTEKDINNFLSKKIFSLNSKKPSRLVSKNINFKKMLIASTIITNNYPNILNLKGKDIENIDLLTYCIYKCSNSIINFMDKRFIFKIKIRFIYIYTLNKINFIKFTHNFLNTNILTLNAIIILYLFARNIYNG